MNYLKELLLTSLEFDLFIGKGFMRLVRYCFFIFFFTLIGCYKSEIKVDPSIRKYYDEFIQDANYFGVDISNIKKLNEIRVIEFESSTEMGVSRTEIYLFHEKRYIDISNKIEDETTKKFVLYHELGHMIFDLDHNLHAEFTLMSPSIPVDNIDPSLWLELKKNFFMSIKSKQ